MKIQPCALPSVMTSALPGVLPRALRYALLCVVAVGTTACRTTPPESSSDTIVVRLEPSQSRGPFAEGFTIAHPPDPTRGDVFSATIEQVTDIPDSLGDAVVYDENMQIRQLVYQSFKSGVMDSTYYASWIGGSGLDESLYTTESVDQKIQYLVARAADGSYVVIADANNDESFAGERSYTIPADAPGSWIENLLSLPRIPVEYEVFDRSAIRTKSSKILINPYLPLPPGMHGLGFGGSESYDGVLELNGDRYAVWAGMSNVGAIEPDEALLWVEPIVGGDVPDHAARQEAVLQRLKADSTFDTSGFPPQFLPGVDEPYKIDDLIPIGDATYRFVSISPLGTQVTLVRTESSEYGLRTGLTAPDFEARTLEGSTIRLSDYRGKFVLIDFWGTWCSPCLGEVPYLKAAYETWPRDQFEILAIANDDVDSLRAFVEREELPWTQVPQMEGSDSLSNVLDAYRITGYPTTLLVDPNGVIVAREGELRTENLARTLQEQLAMRP